MKKNRVNKEIKSRDKKVKKQTSKYLKALILSSPENVLVCERRGILSSK